MDDMIELEICCGTACYLLGADALVDIEDNLPDELKGKVEITPRTCLGLCEDDKLGGAPFVRFNGTEIMAQATPNKVMERLMEIAGGEQANA